MKKGKSLANEMLDLTMEMIYLLTGEACAVVRKTSGDPLVPIKQPPAHSLTPERNIDKKILEVINKMIELLAGKEEECRDGHQNLCKDVYMEKGSPYTSPGGSSKGNPLTRRADSFYSRSSIQEQQNIHHRYQDGDMIKIKVEVEEEPYVNGDEQYMEEVPPEISTVGGQKTSKTSQEDLFSMEGVQKTRKASQIHLLSMPGGQKTSEESNKHSLPIAGRQKTSETSQRHLLSMTGGQKTSEVSHGHLLSVVSKHKTSETSQRQHLSVIGGQKTSEVSQGHLALSLEDTTEYDDFTVGFPGEDLINPTFHTEVSGAHFLQPLMLVGQHPGHSNTVTNYKYCQGNNTFICSECGNCFSLKLPLEAHRRIRRQKIQLLCPYCRQCFAQRAGLEKYSCSDCGKSFLQKSDLVRHIRSHTGEKPFECQECGKRFTLKGALGVHQRSHTGERPFCCSVCGKRFARKVILRNHERIHTGEKPFACPDCKKCFAQSVSLFRHRKTHTR
ncbi:gastrula zinc finger protein XlCGF48.2-like [Hyperolius riggenbachi]|uniref:gastrula zinc finger protein XlCGF48.2-like n=1 Tax=Hyperolius riggenbachi TaxID=752182 RepID=UPI0035A34986